MGIRDISDKKIVDIQSFELFDVINEETKFPTKFGPQVKKLFLHFDKVDYINSTGLRDWIHWVNNFKAANPGISITLVNLTLPFIRHIEVIREILPDHIQVESFSYDFYCPKCNEERSIFTPNKKDLSKNWPVKCAECGTDMEPNILPETYQLLQRHAPK